MDKISVLDYEKSKYVKSIIFYAVFFIIISSIVMMITYVFLDKASVFKPAYNYLSINYSTYHNLFMYLCLAIALVFLCFQPLKKDWIKFKQEALLNSILMIVGVFAIYFGNIISGVLEQSLGISGESSNQQSIELMTKSYFIPMFLSAGILGPITEELIYRKSIFELTDNKWTGLLVSTLCFGFIHVISAGDFIMVIPYLISGLVLGLIYIWTNKNIFIVIGAHMLCNIISLLLITLI